MCGFEINLGGLRMISVSEAQKIILGSTQPLGMEKVSLSKCLGFVLAEDIYAPISLPVADNSAMDGFALGSRETRKAKETTPLHLLIRGTIKAGDARKRSLNPNETYRIMTGAVIPRRADTVIPKEEATIQGNSLLVSWPVPRGRHFRYQGEEVKKGKLVLNRYSVVHPATVGILASLGREYVKVFRKPKISVIATGRELSRPGVRLRLGRIYDSNSFLLASCLKQMGVPCLGVRRVGDHSKFLRQVVRRAIRTSDIVVLTGGVSVGEYDYVKDTLKTCRVKTIFWQVSQKPGKPLYFGKKGHVLVFGLPGNPASVFTCFYEYVFPAIRQMAGFRNPYLKREEAVLQKKVECDSKKFLFLKARYEFDGKGKKVKPLSFQGSHMISSLQEANCFLLVSPGRRQIRKGALASIDLFPWDGEGEL